MSSDDLLIQHIAVIIAMEAEAQPFLTAYNLQPCAWKSNVFLPCTAYQGPFGQGTVTVIVLGKDKRFDVCSVGTTSGNFTLQ
jgi:hypothetical protein